MQAGHVGRGGAASRRRGGRRPGRDQPGAHPRAAREGHGLAVAVRRGRGAMPSRRRPRPTTSGRRSRRRRSGRRSSGGSGIRLVNLGQNLKAGDAHRLAPGARPHLRRFLPSAAGAAPDCRRPDRAARPATRSRTAPIEGKITAINPDVDTATRNVRVQATVPNPDGPPPSRDVRRRRGRAAGRNKVLVIPATAVLYARLRRHGLRRRREDGPGRRARISWSSGSRSCGSACSEGDFVAVDLGPQGGRHGRHLGRLPAAAGQRGERATTTSRRTRSSRRSRAIPERGSEDQMAP